MKKNHNFNEIFFTKYSNDKDKEGVFSNYQNNKYGKIINQDFIPNYDKMNLIVGRNYIIFNIFELLKDKVCNIINVYGKQYIESVNQIDILIDMLKEFLKEKIFNSTIFFPFDINKEENSEDLKLYKKHSAFIKKNKFDFIKERFNSFESNKNISLDLFPAESAPQVKSKIHQIQNIPRFEKIYFKVEEQENNISIINNIKNCSNKVYFINGFKINNDVLLKLFEQQDLYESKIVLFTENQISQEYLKIPDHIKINNIPFDSLKKIDYEIKLQNQKILNEKTDFDLKIKKMVECNYNEKEDILGQSTTIIKDSNKSNLNYEILFLFNCSNSGLFKMEMESLYQKNLNEITDIIEKKYRMKRIIIKEEESDYYRYNRNPYVFKDYYKARKNKIPNNVKQSLLEKLFVFYSLAFRFLLSEAKQKGIKESDNNIKIKLKTKYKPNESLTSFSAIQELGIWLPFEKNENYEINKYLKVINIYGYFHHLLRNFKDMFNNENIILCLKNQQTWKNVRGKIEDISITLLTFIKMFSLTENKLINTFTQLLKKKDNFMHSSFARFQLFDFMSYEYSNYKKKDLKELLDIEDSFKKYGYKEGELETLFARCIVHYKRNKDLTMFDHIYKNEIMFKLFELKEDSTYPMDGEKNKERFISLFECKVKYKYIKYKIRLGILIDSDLSELEQVVSDFKKKECFFYVIKTCFLISEWYLLKKKYENINGKEESDEELEKHINYLNFAYYISNIYSLVKKDRKYLDNARCYIKKQFGLTKTENSQEIKENIKLLCNKFKINSEEKNLNLLSFYVY